MEPHKTKDPSNGTGTPKHEPLPHIIRLLDHIPVEVPAAPGRVGGLVDWMAERSDASHSQAGVEVDTM